MKPDKNFTENDKKIDLKNIRTVKTSTAIYIVAIFIALGTLMVAIIWMTHSITNDNNIRNINRVISHPSSQIIITKNGFIPSTITIGLGQAISFQNYDKSDHKIASDPYPQDNGLKGLNSTILKNGDIFNFVFDKKGTFTYHDELNPFKFHGVVIVK